MAFNATSSSSLSAYLCILLVISMKMDLASAVGHISYSALRGHRDHDRVLLGPAPINQNMSKVNLNPLLRRCKPPVYPARRCCRGFRLVACRYLNQLNNVRTNCAADLFRNISKKGSYPLGLFNAKCRRFGTKKGLSCEGYI